MKIAIVVLSVLLFISLAGEALAWTNLNTTNHELVEVRDELNTTEAVLSTTQADLEATQELLELARGATLYMNPTYSEMYNFLQQDKTSDREWTAEYTCRHFSTDVNNNAESQGIRCGYVWIAFEDSDTGHAIVAFETVDRGIIFIEPQSDWQVKLAVGEHYKIAGFYYIEGNPVVESYDIVW